MHVSARLQSLSLINIEVICIYIHSNQKFPCWALQHEIDIHVNGLIQNNAPIHSADNIKSFLLEHEIPCFDWPAQSAELNTVNIVLHNIKQQLCNDKFASHALDENKRDNLDFFHNLVHKNEYTIKGQKILLYTIYYNLTFLFFSEIRFLEGDEPLPPITNSQVPVTSH